MLRDVYLYGVLADEFGEKWTLDVSSPREAAQAINANTGGRFKEVIRDMDISVVRGEDLKKGEKLGEPELSINYGTGDFHICPAISGSGPVEWIIVGLVLLLSAAVVVFGSKIFPYVAPNDQDGNLDEDSSYLFGNKINSANQGQVIPLIYGEVYAGSVVISQGMKAIEIALATDSSSSASSESSESS